MTTQTATIFVYGPLGGRKFSATATDAAMTEITSSTGTYSLYKVMKGKTLTHYCAEYDAGIGRAQIRNTQTNEIKAIMIMDVVGEMTYRKLDRPVMVDQNDKIEAYVDVA